MRSHPGVSLDGTPIILVWGNVGAHVSQLSRSVGCPSWTSGKGYGSPSKTVR